jgi:hypothetical protein
MKTDYEIEELLKKINEGYGSDIVKPLSSFSKTMTGGNHQGIEKQKETEEMEEEEEEEEEFRDLDVTIAKRTLFTPTSTPHGEGKVGIVLPPHILYKKDYVVLGWPKIPNTIPSCTFPDNYSLLIRIQMKRLPEFACAEFLRVVETFDQTIQKDDEDFRKIFSTDLSTEQLLTMDFEIDVTGSENFFYVIVKKRQEKWLQIPEKDMSTFFDSSNKINETPKC